MEQMFLRACPLNHVEPIKKSDHVGSVTQGWGKDLYLPQWHDIAEYTASAQHNNNDILVVTFNDLLTC